MVAIPVMRKSCGLAKSTNPRTSHAAKPNPRPEIDVKNIIDQAGRILNYPSFSKVESTHFQKPLGVASCAIASSDTGVSSLARRGRGGRYLFTGLVFCSGIRSKPPRAATIWLTSEVGSPRSPKCRAFVGQVRTQAGT